MDISLNTVLTAEERAKFGISDGLVRLSVGLETLADLQADIGQALDAAYLSPTIVGPKIGLHPVWLIFSLFAFSYLFGFTGMLVAVPVAAAIGVVVRFALTAYLNSTVYQGPRE